jgi:uncharacterized protein YcgI (DUF1989 family)
MKTSLAYFTHAYVCCILINLDQEGTTLMQRGHVQVKKYCSLRAFCRVIVLPAVSM